MINVSSFSHIQYVTQKDAFNVSKKDPTSFLLKPEDKRTVRARISDFFKSFDHHKLMVEAYGRRKIHYHSPQKRPEYISIENARYPVEKLPWYHDNQSDGLCVFVHGYKGAPYCWDEYIEDVQQLNLEQGRRVHCFIPLVLEGGDCSLEEGGTPILAAIHEYAKKYPGKPIYLFGASNGGKIIGYLDRMIKLEDTQVKVVSIVGIHFGSRILDIFPAFIQKRVFKISEKVLQDFKYGSTVNQARLKSWRDFAQDNDRQTGRLRFFFAATAIALAAAQNLCIACLEFNPDPKHIKKVYKVEISKDQVISLENPLARGTYSVFFQFIKSLMIFLTPESIHDTFNDYAYEIYECLRFPEMRSLWVAMSNALIKTPLEERPAFFDIVKNINTISRENKSGLDVRSRKLNDYFQKELDDPKKQGKFLTALITLNQFFGQLVLDKFKETDKDSISDEIYQKISQYYSYQFAKVPTEKQFEELMDLLFKKLSPIREKYFASNLIDVVNKNKSELPIVCNIGKNHYNGMVTNLQKLCKTQDKEMTSIVREGKNF